MTLHLTSCRRADFGATEARDLAQDIENGDIELGTVFVVRDGEYVFDTDANNRNRLLVVAALRAFA